MIPYAVIDVETTTFAKGNPYAARNRLCYVGVTVDGINHTFCIDVGGKPYRDELAQILGLLDGVGRIVVFNGKFDLAWLYRYGIDLSDREIWDLQLAEFLSHHQSKPYPSLDETLLEYGLPPKDDTVEREYWSVGIDTDHIPTEVITRYLEQDLRCEDALYRIQLEHFPQNLRSLFRLQCQDLLVLLEMERNGILFDFGSMAHERERTSNSLAGVDNRLRDFADRWPYFNPDSGDHVSALLYGGTVSCKVSEPYEHTYKAGKRAGLTETRNKWRLETKTYPGLVKPLEGSELKKEGYYSTEESTLLKLRSKARNVIDTLLERSKLEQLLSTYLVGIPNHLEKYGWEDGIIHGTLNQCKAITGRLSAEKPNQQNFPEEIQKYIKTRFS